MHDQITVVVGIDAKTIEYLKVSCETWRVNRPEMWRMPWVLFCDWTAPGGLLLDAVDRMLTQLAVPDIKVVMWPGTGVPRSAYESQREMMLSGHVWVPAESVKTRYSMKIDCDVLALRPEKWLDEAWFADLDPEADCDTEVRYVAPSWNYTKGINYLGRLEEWGDTVNWGPHGVHPRLDIPFDPTHLRVPHKRMCSWLSFYSVEWLRWLCGELERTVGKGKLPVPSQDTTVWYAAERERAGHNDNRAPGSYRHVNMKRLGWTNVPKLPNLIEQANAILAGRVQASMVDG